jgi:hypothetical protein
MYLGLALLGTQGAGRTRGVSRRARVLFFFFFGTLRPRGRRRNFAPAAATLHEFQERPVKERFTASAPPTTYGKHSSEISQQKHAYRRQETSSKRRQQRKRRM